MMRTDTLVEPDDQSYSVISLVLYCAGLGMGNLSECSVAFDVSGATAGRELLEVFLFLLGKTVENCRKPIGHVQGFCFFINQPNEEKQMAQTQGSNRGFAAMDQDKQREIASKGGKAAHEKGTAHEFSSQQAAEAGSKGGKAAHAKGTAHEFSSQEAAAAGRKGGLSSHGGRT